ncbi:FHA domain-containing protein [Luteimonas deserti]|uniref:FHA domain-containing protein n=1 Tax=Luteimonas deserti TaxID=2752306 RepID=A0A7Z0QNX8_9GAMM|nr:FHA domain-containing protein [Luteimonas deserti]NYZ62096.1 FHA domain-containing protein [Luteimonas deserti]
MIQTSDTPAVDEVLRIVDGLHSGASRVLGRDEMILVGNGEDCDIVLADDGVAHHHALLTLVGGRFLVRALDAPVEIGGERIQPGDPVELSAVQPVRIGQAAIAFGREDDPAWDGFVPVFGPDEDTPPPRPALVRRLPLIAGVAALSLASLAIFAAVLPAPERTVDARERLAALMTEHRVANVEIVDGVDGRPAVTGAIDSREGLDRLRAQLQAEGIDANLQLRSGENIASDVAEMFRGHGIPVRARYAGNGDVEVTGEFEDGDEIERLVRSRAVADIRGVTRILPRTPAGTTPAGGPPAAEAPAPAHIVSIVRGNDPHLVDADGRRFVPGDTVPGKGTLISIGEFAHVLAGTGELVKVVPGPPPADPEVEPAGANQDDARFGAVIASATSRTAVSPGEDAPSGSQ